MHFEKTEEEITFLNLYARVINTNTDLEHEKVIKIMNFISNSEFYYDVFCEAVYSVMKDDRVETLSLDDKGHLRLNLCSTLAFDAGYELLSKGDVSNPYDDVIVYVNIALQRLSQRVSQKECLGA